jgi:hypothetical protein
MICERGLHVPSAVKGRVIIWVGCADLGLQSVSRKHLPYFILFVKNRKRIVVFIKLIKIIFKLSFALLLFMLAIC